MLCVCRHDTGNQHDQGTLLCLCHLPPILAVHAVQKTTQAPIKARPCEASAMSRRGGPITSVEYILLTSVPELYLHIASRLYGASFGLIVAQFVDAE